MNHANDTVTGTIRINAGIYSAQTLEAVFLETYSLTGINMVQQRRENQETGNGEEYVNT